MLIFKTYNLLFIIDYNNKQIFQMTNISSKKSKKLYNKINKLLMTLNQDNYKYKQLIIIIQKINKI